MSKLLCRGAVLAGCSAFLSFPHDPITTKITWTQEISRIVYKNCAGCHRPDGRAMSLTTYDDARPWAKAIRDEVAARRMPPWGAVAGIGDFAGDPSLSTPEIDLLIAWVEGGAPEGDPAYLPRVRDAGPEQGATPRGTRALSVTGAMTLRNAMTLVGIRPAGELEAWAVLPDQSIRRLIRTKNYRKEWARTFLLREPEKLPPGTKLRAEGASAVFLVR